MEIISNEYTVDNISYALDKYFDSNTIFFDIECTGLSPRKSFIYMIGYAERLGNKISITQLLAKDESEEIVSLLRQLSVFFENKSQKKSKKLLTNAENGTIIQTSKKVKVKIKSQI